MQHALELLDHARRLLSPTGGVPTQADLRRAVSASYYALFHLLIAAATDCVGQSASTAVRFRMMRAFGHREMRKVCEQFERVTASAVPKLLDGLVAAPLHPDLTYVSGAFSALQDARHLADYDLELPVTDLYAAAMFKSAQRCLAVWPSIQALPETTTFLTALLLADRWTRRG